MDTWTSEFVGANSGEAKFLFRLVKLISFIISFFHGGCLAHECNLPLDNNGGDRSSCGKYPVAPVAGS